MPTWQDLADTHSLRRIVVSSPSSVSRRIFLFLTRGLLSKFLPASIVTKTAQICNTVTTPDERYRAYLATKCAGSPRIPIEADRVVVVLGEDELGQALEISIDLTRPTSNASHLVVYAIREPVENVATWTRWPRLIVSRVPAVNVAQVEVVFEHVD
jgi:hypothetical protein